jgi:hypothetical protein
MASRNTIAVAEVEVMARLDKMQKDLDKAVVKTKRATDAMGGGFAKVTKHLKFMIGALGLTVGIAQMATLGRQTLAWANNLEKASRRLGVTVDTMQRLERAGDLIGENFRALEVGSQRLFRRFGDGTESAIGALRELGVVQEDGTTTLRTQDELLKETLRALARIEDTNKRLALSFALFDTEGTEAFGNVISNAESLNAIVDEIETGLTDDQIAALKQLDLEWRAFWTDVRDWGRAAVLDIAKAIKVMLSPIEALKDFWDGIGRARADTLRGLAATFPGQSAAGGLPDPSDLAPGTVGANLVAGQSAAARKKMEEEARKLRESGSKWVEELTLTWAEEFDKQLLLLDIWVTETVATLKRMSDQGAITASEFELAMQQVSEIAQKREEEIREAMSTEGFEEEFDGMVLSFGDALGRMVTDAQSSFQQILASFGRMVAQMVIQQGTQALIGKALGAASSIFGAAGANAAATADQGIVGSIDRPLFPDITINNSAPGAVAGIDPVLSGADSIVIGVVTEDLNQNGPIAQNLQTQFGISRPGNP